MLFLSNNFDYVKPISGPSEDSFTNHPTRNLDDIVALLAYEEIAILADDVEYTWQQLV